MRVEDHGYWQAISIDTEMALKDPLVLKLFTNEFDDTKAPDKSELFSTIEKVVFEHKPVEHLTLIDAANILSLSSSARQSAYDATSSPEEVLVNAAAKAYVADVMEAVMATFAMFNISGHARFSDYVKEEFRTTPCSLTAEGREESIFILTLWLSHHKNVADEVGGDLNFGAVSIPREYGQGFCFPRLKRFALEDARLRKKIPSLVGATPSEVEAYLERMKRDIK